MRLNQPIRAFVACVIAILPSAVLGQNVVYVDADATGANDGTSWQNAFTDLQDGIAQATAGTQIWVAEGTYHPAGMGGDRTAAFVLRPGVEIYGGFLGNETSIEERPTPLAVTTLSGDLMGNDKGPVSLDESTRADNSFHVVTCLRSESTTASLLDGVTVVSGNANGMPVNGTTIGGGLDCVDRVLVLSNCVFTRNAAQFGGGIALRGGKTTISEVRAESNYADLEGAGLYVDNSDVTADRLQLWSNVSVSTGAGIMVRGNLLKARRLVVSDNQAIFGGGVSVLKGTLWLVDSRLVGNKTVGQGAAMYADASDVLVANTVVSGNRARHQGAGIWTIDGDLQVINATIFHNRADSSGGGSFHWGGRQTYQNGVLAGNSAPVGRQVWGFTNPNRPNRKPDLRISTSVIEGGINEVVVDSGGNVFESPIFEDTLGADLIPGTLDDSLSLREGSPGIDIGDNAALPPDSLDDDDDGDVSEPIPFDISGNPRVADGGSGFLVVDAGAYEYAKGTSSIGDSGIEVLRRIGARVEAYPNPATSDATIILHPGSFSEYGQLVLYDVQGRLVARLYSGLVQPGNDIHLPAPRHLPPGLYAFVFHGTRTSSAESFIKVR